MYHSRSMKGTSGAMRRLGIEGAVMAAIGVAAALIGPFGTYALPLATRFADWLLFAFGGYVFFRPVIAGGEALAASTAMPRMVGIALANLLGALPTTLLVAWALSGMRVRQVQVGELASLYPQVVLVGLITTGILLLLRRDRHATPPALPEEPPRKVAPAAASPEPVPAAAPDAPAGFLDRLPPHLGRDLLALENEDHYLRCHTAIGSALVLMRLRDAVESLGAIEGRRVHRGWWVARRAVTGVERRERKVLLRLSNGLEVPVARNEVPALRAAGWL